MDLESKAINPEIKTAFDDFLSAFEAFKQANDERLAELERRSADVVTEEKVDRINAALSDHKRVLDELTLAASRPAVGSERKAAPRGPARHCAILAEKDGRLTLIHARQNKRVSEEAFSRFWQVRCAYAFRLR